MNKLVLNDYLSSLHRQISVSVDKLKDKNSAPQSAETGTGDGALQSYRYGVSERAYSLLDSDVSYQMFSYGGRQGADSSYAAQSYSSVAKVDKPSTVLIDFMFENNREFDFKV